MHFLLYCLLKITELFYTLKLSTLFFQQFLRVQSTWFLNISMFFSYFQSEAPYKGVFYQFKYIQ